MIRNIKQIVTPALLLLSLGIIAACSQTTANTPTTAATQAAPQATETQPPTQPASFSDPFSYCASIGTIDQPDARYSGEAVPNSIIQGFLKAAEIENSSEPSEMLPKSTIWRCMDKSVYVCNFGANLPCDSKANTEKNPTQAMVDFCKENANSDFIPMAITGHTTIYSWHCVNDIPEAGEQIDQVDAAGYLSRIWYKLEPNP